MTAYNDA